MKANSTRPVSTAPAANRDPFIAADGGFTSAGVVVALLLVIALLFTSAQVYWLNSTAGDVQFAADAGALAAENVVAEYYVVARIADAITLSLSLLGIAVFGVSIVVSCVPGMQAAGAEMMQFGTRIFRMRDEFAKQSTEALVQLQKALPLLSVANAAAVISANRFSASGSASYLGFAIIVPIQGEEPDFGDDAAAEDAAADIAERNPETAELTDQAAEAKERMDAAKLRAWQADCGASPDYCMYDRASDLAGMSGLSNPYFASVETWRFDYAFDRAEAYYRRRLAIEAPANNTIAEQTRSFVRKQFYAYAIEELSRGYAHTDADGVLDADFPLLARNTTEIRSTRLYTDAVYPVDSSGCLHGVTTCPDYQANGGAGQASIADLDAGTYQACALCDIGVSTVGKVASASTSISSGFEYHYRIVAEQARAYEQASREYRELSDQAKASAGESLTDFEEALAALKAPRFDPKPPGRCGCIAIAFDPASRSIPDGLSSSFVSSQASLPPRVAISAAALACDQASEGNNILASFADRMRASVSQSSVWAAGLDVFDGILTIWGDLLLVYSQGADSLAKGVGDFLRSIPVLGDTPLASWAQDSLQHSIEACGLQGVDLSAPKPVLVNSIHVVNASDSELLGALGSAKQSYSALPGSGSGSLAAGVVDGVLVGVESAGAEYLEGEITIYTLRFGDVAGAPEIPIRIKLPPQAVEAGRSILRSATDGVRSLFGGGSGAQAWQ
ncbi:MAG: hypothetical protein LBR39_00185 [Coriobacteriales bacterium]|nr:hypothetical protein [Coriobacteriales bacterium]